MTLPKHVTIVEVGPRDGLQNEPNAIPTEEKLALIRSLSEAGLSHIETTSFVSPKWVPQMADHDIICKELNNNDGTHYYALVPNERGLDDALACGVTHLSVVTTCSETFAQKNTNCSINDSLQRIQSIRKKTQQAALPIRAYLSCCMGCPYEGDTSLNTITDIAKQLIDMGCNQVVLSDTIGTGTPERMKRLIERVLNEVPLDKLAVHCHDTYGQALANIYASLCMGICTIDAAVAGLGGCPYAPGAGGNVATEDVVYLCEGLGIQTGINLQRLTQAGQRMTEFLNITPRSKAAIALQNKQYS